MNKVISVYELLGLIKDDKAPKRISYEDKIWNYDYRNDYLDKDGNMLFEDYCYTYRLNDKVEILEK